MRFAYTPDVAGESFYRDRVSGIGGCEMRTMAIVCCITASVFSVSQAFGASATTCTLAEIMTTLEHYPNDSQKQQLAEIIESDDSSEAEIAVATAISNFEHQVAEDDQAKLNSIIEDDSTPDELRQVATILLGAQHHPSEADIEKLEGITADCSGQ